MIYIREDETSIVVDVGITCKLAEQRMRKAEIQPGSVDAIFITHEHSDHIRGVSVYSRKYGIPIHISKKAMARIEDECFDWHEVRGFTVGDVLRTGSLMVRSVHTSHDAEDPVGYVIESDKGSKCGIATDLGIYTSDIVEAYQGLDVLLLEFNHDSRMLVNGNYPAFLKRRIASELGHLSNSQAGKLLEKLAHPELKTVILGHLSEQNNRPDIAYSSAELVLKRCNSDAEIIVAEQHNPSPAVVVGELPVGQLAMF